MNWIKQGSMRRLNSFITLTAVFSVAVVISAAIADEVVISYRRSVTLSIGQSAVIHGARGDCGAPAPSWSDVEAKLPKLSVGTFSDGGVGVRNSNACGGPTPARAISVTGTKSGTENIVLYGDPITITVK
jgi:hypothetical protein